MEDIMHKIALTLALLTGVSFVSLIILLDVKSEKPAVIAGICLLICLFLWVVYAGS
jgi:hypothetical protein